MTVALASAPQITFFSSVATDVYRRRRLVALALLVGLVLGLVLGLGLFIRGVDATPASNPAAVELVSVLVQPGDTLWAIASRLNPGNDPRQLVYQLTDLVGSSSLQVGQEIVVPAGMLA